MKLALFFTLGVSLETWKKVGMFDREVKPYLRLAGSTYDKIYFLTYGVADRQYQAELGGNIIILPKRWRLPDKLYSLLLPFVHRKELHSADLYKTNQMPGSWAAVLAKFLYRKKLLVRCGYQWSLQAAGWNAGGLKKFFIYLAELLAYRSADAISVTSDQAKIYIETRYKIKPEKVNLLSNYVDTDLFKPLDVPKIKNSLCFVGRFEEQKNLPALLEALAGLDARLILFGTGSKEAELKSLVEKFGVAAEFKGNVPNDRLPEELNKCEIFILPSLYEGNPKVLLEAMACGLPVIGTKVQGIGNILKHGENGYLCEPTAESIRLAIQAVLGDDSLKEKLGRRAKAYILENCSLDRIINLENDVVKNLV